MTCTYISLIYRDLEEAEDQYQMALRTHLVNIDTLIKLHDSRLYALERNFQQELKTLQEDFYNDKDAMIEKFQNEKMELKAIIEAIDQEEDTRNMEVKCTFSNNLFHVRTMIFIQVSIALIVRLNMFSNNFARKLKVVTTKKLIHCVLRWTIKLKI